MAVRRRPEMPQFYVKIVGEFLGVALSALIFFVYWVNARLFGGAPPVIGKSWLVALLVVLLAGSALAVYRLSLQAHARYGEYFKALFDQHWKVIDIDTTLQVVAARTGDAEVLALASVPASRKYPERGYRPLRESASSGDPGLNFR